MKHWRFRLIVQLLGFQKTHVVEDIDANKDGYDDDERNEDVGKDSGNHEDLSQAEEGGLSDKLGEKGNPNIHYHKQMN